MALEPQGSFQNRRVVAVVVSLLVTALFVAGLLFYVTKQNNTNTPAQQTVTVVVARTLVPHQTKLDGSNVQEVQRPVDQVPQGVLHLADITAAPKYTNVDVPAGDILTSYNTVDSALSAGTANRLPPLDLHNGNVAMAIPTDEQKGVGGFVQAGDHIDVIMQKCDSSVRYMLQDIKVLRVGQAAAQQAATAGAVGTVTLMVVELPRPQAEELALLVAGTQQASTCVTPPSALRYVLRPRSQWSIDATLKLDISDSAPSITVTDQATLPHVLPSTPLLVTIDDEQMHVTAITVNNDSTDTWTVERGVGGTPKQAHKASASITGPQTYLRNGDRTPPDTGDTGVDIKTLDSLFPR